MPTRRFTYLALFMCLTGWITSQSVDAQPTHAKKQVHHKIAHSIPHRMPAVRQVAMKAQGRVHGLNEEDNKNDAPPPVTYQPEQWDAYMRAIVHQQQMPPAPAGFRRQGNGHTNTSIGSTWEFIGPRKLVFKGLGTNSGRVNALAYAAKGP